MAANPAPRIARLTSTPGCGSASRAGPIGISGDAAMATATATMAPVTVTIPSRASDRVTSAARFTPSARRMGNSAASSASWRLSSWPMTASAISPASPAKTASATASGLMARSVALTWSDRLMVMMFPRCPDAGGARVALGERFRGAGERGLRRARLEPDRGLVSVGEVRRHGRRGERPADQGGRQGGVGAGGHDLVVEHDDRGHPVRQRDGLVVLGGAAGGAGHPVQAQRAARRQVLQAGELLVDHGLPGCLRVVQPARQDLDPVDADAHGPVRTRHQVDRSSGCAATAPSCRCGRGHRRDVRLPGERREVPGDPGVLGDDVDLGCVRPGQQPRVGGVGAPRPGGGGQHHAADEPEQHGEAEQRRPAPPDVRAQREPDRGHSQHSIAAPAGRQYGRHPGGSGAAITPRAAPWRDAAGPRSSRARRR